MHKMKKSDLRRQITAYQEINEQIAALEKKKEAIAVKIKQYMGDNEEEKIGDFVIRYKTITSKRFDTTSFAESHKDLYDQFLRPATTKRFSITA